MHQCADLCLINIWLLLADAIMRSKSVATILGVKRTRQAMVDSEMLLAANWLAQSRLFFSAMYAAFTKLSEILFDIDTGARCCELGLSYEAHVIRFDVPLLNY